MSSKNRFHLPFPPRPKQIGRASLAKRREEPCRRAKGHLPHQAGDRLRENPESLPPSSALVEGISVYCFLCFGGGLDTPPLLLGRTSEKAAHENLYAPMRGSIFRLPARRDQEVPPSLGLVFPRGLLRRVYPRPPLREIFLAALDKRATAAPA